MGAQESHHHHHHTELLLLQPNLKDNVYRVMVFGQTGAGKSSFLNKIIGKDFFEVIHDNVSPTTNEIAASEIFTMSNGRQVQLYDVPGLNDFDRGNIEIFNLIATQLRQSLHDRLFFSAFVFIVPINMPKITSIVRDNYELFRAMLGDEAVEHRAILCTTFWDCVDDSVGAASERFLLEALGPGPKLQAFRHYGTPESRTAIGIMDCLVRERPFPAVVKFQAEIAVNDSILNTTAGAIYRERKAETIHALNQRLPGRDDQETRKLTERIEALEQMN